MAPRGLGPCDLLTPEEACRALHVRDSVGMAWLRERNLLRTIGTRLVVPWGEAYQRVVAGDGPSNEPTTPPPSPRPRGGGSLPRVPLG
jgi:hypothetical protein